MGDIVGHNFVLHPQRALGFYFDIPFLLVADFFQPLGSHIGVSDAADACRDGNDSEIHSILQALSADGQAKTGPFGQRPEWLNLRFCRGFNHRHRPFFSQ